MRFALNQIERLPPAAFVLLFGLIGGTLQGLREFASRKPAGVLVGFLILGGAAVVLWWLSVRRRQHSVWSAAFQLVLVLGVSQFVAQLLVMPRIVPAGRQIPWLDASMSMLSMQFVLSPIRFLVAAPLVALGRLLPGSARHQAEQPRREKEFATPDRPSAR